MTQASLVHSAALIAAFSIAMPAVASADTSSDATPINERVATEPPLAPLATPAAPDSTVQRSATPFVSRGRFSAPRLVVEIVAGATVGSLVGYGVYRAAGGGDSLAAAFAGLGAEIAVVPLVVYGTGRMMGGEGTLYGAYYGGLAAFAGPAATTEQATLSLAIGMAVMPITSAVVYEISSHMRSRRLEALANGFTVAPTVDSNGVSGVRAGLSFGF